jgi:hypothetical protein
MLGFVFWHWPEPETRIPEYEQKLVTFHQALANSRVPGVRASATFRVAGAPWLGPGRSGYEDWYFVDGYSALETLNLAAVTESRRASHDRVAQLAAGGAGGLYALISGSGDMGALTFVTWLTKPKGLAYADFYEMVRPWTDVTPTSLWRRQLVLGPAPEFCLMEDNPDELPSTLRPLRFDRRLVWSGEL